MISNNNTSTTNKSDTGTATNGEMITTQSQQIDTKSSKSQCTTKAVSTTARPVFQDLTNQPPGENLDRTKVNNSPQLPNNHRNMNELNRTNNVVPLREHNNTQQRISLADNSSFNQSSSFNSNTNNTNTTDSSSGRMLNNSSNSFTSNNQQRSSTLSVEHIIGRIGKCKRTRKARSIFSVEQLTVLNDEFERHNYINTHTREELGRRIGINADQVKVWFQNMRSKRRKLSERAASFNPADYEYVIQQQQFVNNLTQSPRHHYSGVSSSFPSNNNNNNNIGGHRIPPPTPTTNSSTMDAPTILVNYSGNSAANSSSFPFRNNTNGSSGHRQSSSINNGHSQQLNNSLYWEPSNKKNKCNVFPIPAQNNTNLSYCSNPNQSAYVVTPPLHNNNNNNNNSGHLTGVNNKGSSFVAPGFASTLYNANKVNNESKVMGNFEHQPNTSCKSTFPLNTTCSTNSNSSSSRQTPPKQHYATTSTPHKNNGQMMMMMNNNNPNNYYNNNSNNNSLHPFPSHTPTTTQQQPSCSSIRNSRLYLTNNNNPKNSAPITQQNNMRPNH